MIVLRQNQIAPCVLKPVDQPRPWREPPDLLDDFRAWEEFAVKQALYTERYTRDDNSWGVRKLTIYEYVVSRFVTGVYGRCHTCEFLASLNIPPMDEAEFYAKQARFRAYLYWWMFGRVRLLAKDTFRFEGIERRVLYMEK
jgi:hypothetical protein